MGWKEFELKKWDEDEEKTYELPYSAPAPISQSASEVLHGEAEGKIQGEKLNASLKTKNVEKASHHIVKELLEMESIPRERKLKLDDLDGESLDKLKQHYLEVDLLGKNSEQSDDEQSS